LTVNCRRARDSQCAFQLIDESVSLDLDSARAFHRPLLVNDPQETRDGSPDQNSSLKLTAELGGRGERSKQADVSVYTAGLRELDKAAGASDTHLLHRSSGQEHIAGALKDNQHGWVWREAEIHEDWIKILGSALNPFSQRMRGHFRNVRQGLRRTLVDKFRMEAQKNLGSDPGVDG
jgi:hypothetical protein